MTTVARYGSWASPITADRLVQRAVSLGQVVVDGADVYWNEGRPAEGGRQVIMRWTPGAEGSVEVLPQGFAARSTVHEYGGGAFTVRDGVVWFVNFADQRVYRFEPGAEGGPEPVTPDGARYADLTVRPDGTGVAAVRERHLDSGEVVNDLVLLPDVVVAEGHDFYAAPRWSPSDGRLAWLSWDHPNMPWDGTELWVDGELVAGGPDESISQPRWAPDGSLLWASDRTGWWNLYRDGRILAEEEAEYSGPDWVFGLSRYTVLPDGMVAAVRTRNGVGELTVVAVGGGVRPVATPSTSFSSVQAYGEGSVVAVAASATEAPAVVRIDLGNGGGRGHPPQSGGDVRPRLPLPPPSGDVPHRRRTRGPRPLLPADQPRLRGTRGRAPAVGGDEPRGPDGGGRVRPQPQGPVLHQPGPGRGRRRLRGEHRLRAGLPAAAGRAVGRRRRGRLRQRRPPPGRR